MYPVRLGRTNAEECGDPNYPIYEPKTNPTRGTKAERLSQKLHNYNHKQKSKKSYILTHLLRQAPILPSKIIAMASDYLNSIFSLQGKTAIITGGTGGIGSSLAMALAKAGASIISIELPNDPNSTNLANSIAEIGGSSRVFHCDLAKKEDLRACYASIWDAGIVPDILVNSAGIQRRNPCEDATDDDLDQVRSFPIRLSNDIYMT